MVFCRKSLSLLRPLVEIASIYVLDLQLLPRNLWWDTTNTWWFIDFSCNSVRISVVDWIVRCAWPIWNLIDDIVSIQPPEIVSNRMTFMGTGILNRFITKVWTEKNVNIQIQFTLPPFFWPHKTWCWWHGIAMSMMLPGKCVFCYT